MLRLVTTISLAFALNACGSSYCTRKCKEPEVRLQLEELANIYGFEVDCEAPALNQAEDCRACDKAFIEVFVVEHVSGTFCREGE